MLAADDLEAALAELGRMDPGLAVRLVTARLASHDEMEKWRAVEALGVLVRDLAARDLEKAREVMRRLCWSLNEESGAIGWGAPEALGEIMARTPALAEEFANLLISYVWRDCNYLEFTPLQHGAVWGLGRLAMAQPELLRRRGAAEHLLPHLTGEDDRLRGLAAWALGVLGMGQGGEAARTLSGLADDPAPVRLYLDGRLESSTVGALARRALSKNSH